MWNKKQLTIIGMVLGCAGAGAAAQTVYRCASAYSQVPCTGGHVIDTSETMQTQQDGKGPSAAERDAKAAAALERDRLRLEANAAPAYIPRPQESAAKSRTGANKPRKVEEFTALAPARTGDGKKQKKKKKKAAGKY